MFMPPMATSITSCTSRILTPQRDFGSVDFIFDVRFAHDPVGHDIDGSRDLLQQRFHLQTDAFDFARVCTTDFHTPHGSKAGLQHHQSSLDRLQPGRQDTGDCGLRFKFLKNFLLRDCSLFRKEKGDQETTEVRYFISSLRLGVKQFARSARGHRALRTVSTGAWM